MRTRMTFIDNLLDDNRCERRRLFRGRCGSGGRGRAGCQCGGVLRRFAGGNGRRSFSHYLPLNPSKTSENDGWLSCEILTRAASIITGIG